MVVAEFVTVAQLDEIVPGRPKVVEARGIPIALFNLNGVIVAVSNLCPHEGGPLAAGRLRGSVIVCPWHRWQFDLLTGVSPTNPALSIRRFSVRIDGDQVMIDLDGAAAAGLWD